VLLVANLMIDREYADLFDESAGRAARELGLEMTTRRHPELPRPGELEPFTHLLISGSEASVVEEQPWEEALAALVRAWSTTGRPMLGICYGHQFLAKVLLGRAHTRRAPEPEFGFRRMELLAEDPLFAGFPDPVFLCCHQDEVVDLPADCTVFARTDLCGVQAARFGAAPFYGVQFHPEYGQAQGEAIFPAAESWCPGASTRVRRDPVAPGQLDQNWRMIVNFLRM
jgi:GMP synthase (glutamine-hydrolysing)